MPESKEKKSSYWEIRIPRLRFGSASVNGFLTTLLVIFAILIGFLLNKVIYLDNALKQAESTQAVSQTGEQQAEPVEDTTPKKVSVDDDPVLGQADAKVTLIEFSDYECPFCKSYFDQTYEQIKKEYVDTGKIKIVFRDLPLSFHANAHKQAQAAECMRDQGGDSAYFKYHDELFKRTTSNGTGLALTQLAPIANELGFNGNTLQTCIDSDKYKEEVDKDFADAQSIGATGTPTFFIGQSSSDGIITGTKLVGAQPFAAFQNLIEAELKK